MVTTTTKSPTLSVQDEATALLPVKNGKCKPVTVIGNEAIRATFDEACLRQAQNAGGAPGVSQLVLNPDAHIGYGAPIGSVLVSPTHIYPGPVGVDIKCSMSLLQFDLPQDQIDDKKLRRALIDAICQRVPTGAGRGQRSVPKSRKLSTSLGRRAVVEGASKWVCDELGIPSTWADRCEDAAHRGHDDTRDALSARLDRMLHDETFASFDEKIRQLGSYGGGNHFGECQFVEVAEDSRAQHCANAFGLQDGNVAFLSHCGSRGFGHHLATSQFRLLRDKFIAWGTPFPGDDQHLVYAPLGTVEANDYLDDIALAGNFATINHLLINALVLEAFQEVLPGVQGTLVYLISHNFARKEQIGWVHRKGATRAYPAGHSELAQTPYQKTGHPILLPGSPTAGSAVMVANYGAEKSGYSINHGAGRVMGRKHAIRTLDQARIDRELAEGDILSNCRRYPRDEAPAVYKDFDEVLASVAQADLAHMVARLRARFVIKDADKADD